MGVSMTGTSNSVVFQLQKSDEIALVTDTFFEVNGGKQIQVENLDVELYSEVSEDDPQLFPIATGGICINNRCRELLSDFGSDCLQFREMTLNGVHGILTQVCASPIYKAVAIGDTLVHTNERGPLDFKELCLTSESITRFGCIAGREDHQELFVSREARSWMWGRNIESVFEPIVVLTEQAFSAISEHRLDQNVVTQLSDPDGLMVLPSRIVLMIIKAAVDYGFRDLANTAYDILKQRKDVPFQAKREALTILK